MLLYKEINHNIYQVGADNSKIDAKINFRNYCVNHFKNLSNKIDKWLLKANKESKTYTDIADAVKLKIVNLDTVF